MTALAWPAVALGAILAAVYVVRLLMLDRSTQATLRAELAAHVKQTTDELEALKQRLQKVEMGRALGRTG